MPQLLRPGHWVSDFASSPNVIGQTVKISDVAHIVIGVMPSGFHYPVGVPAAFWASYAIDNEGPQPATSLRGWDHVGPPAAQISLHCDLTSSRNVTGQPRFRHRRSTESYSRRSVSAGSIRAARRAGRATASNAGPISTNAEPSKTDSDVECAP
jgi:hypothetical protein